MNIVEEEDCSNCDEKNNIDHLDFVAMNCTIHPADDSLIK